MDKHYDILFNAVNDFILVHPFMDQGFASFTMVNDSACEHYGYPREEFLQLSAMDITIEKFANKHKKKKSRKELEEKGKMRFEAVHICKSGEEFPVEINSNVVVIDGKKMILAVVRDITERKKQEEELSQYRNELEKLVLERTQNLENVNKNLQTINSELKGKNQLIEKQKNELETMLRNLKQMQNKLVQSEKMASLGTLTAGVAHEINNPLNFIQGGYLGLENFFDDNKNCGEDTRTWLNAIQTGIERSTKIITVLNQFSRNSESLTETCEIHSIVDDSLLMVNNELKNRIEVVKEYHSEAINVEGNVGKLHQVFLNLLSNASHAIVKEGKITICTSVSDENAHITIKDSGSGIEESILSRVFDPFFTTKDPGIGTGLGLYICYSIIQEHKGIIELDSNSRGTTVTISLPHHP